MWVVLYTLVRSDDMKLVYMYGVIKGTGTEDYLKAYIGNIENSEVGRHDINGGDILVRDGSIGEYIKVLKGYVTSGIL